MRKDYRMFFRVIAAVLIFVSVSGTVFAAVKHKKNKLPVKTVTATAVTTKAPKLEARLFPQKRDNIFTPEDPYKNTAFLADSRIFGPILKTPPPKQKAPEIRVYLPTLNKPDTQIVFKKGGTRELRYKPGTKLAEKPAAQKLYSKFAYPATHSLNLYTVSGLYKEEINRDKFKKEDIRVVIPALNTYTTEIKLYNKKSPVKNKQENRYKTNIEQKLFGKNKPGQFGFIDTFTQPGLLESFVLLVSIIEDPDFYQGKKLPLPRSYVIENDVSVTIADAFNHRIIEIDPHPVEVMWDYGRIGNYSINSGYLHYPSYVEKIGEGMFLITDLGNNRIIKLKKGDNGYGEVLWSYGNGQEGKEANQVFLAETATELPNGNVLITDTSNHRIIEVNSDKEIVWQYGNFDRGTGYNWLDSPQGSSLTANPKQALIADTGNQRVIIVDKESKNILWQYGTTASAGVSYNHLNLPNSAREIFGGNILITDSANHRVMEIDRRTKNILWQYGKTGITGNGFNELNWPYNAYRLPNGNTMIADSDNHRVIEVDVYHRIVWQYGETGIIGSETGLLYAPYDAQITPKDSDYHAGNGETAEVMEMASGSILSKYLEFNPFEDMKRPLFLSQWLAIKLNYDYPCDRIEHERKKLGMSITTVVPPYRLRDEILSVRLTGDYLSGMIYFDGYERETNTPLYQEIALSALPPAIPPPPPPKQHVAKKKKTETPEPPPPPEPIFAAMVRVPVLANNTGVIYESKIDTIGDFSVWESSEILDRYLLLNYIAIRVPEAYNRAGFNDLYARQDIVPFYEEKSYDYYPVSKYGISYLIRSYSHVNMKPLQNLDTGYPQIPVPQKRYPKSVMKF